MNKSDLIRQGDVLLVPVTNIPAGCREVPLERGRIVLMHGEVTGHAHAIADWAGAGCIADDAIALAGRRAPLLVAADGARYLEVTEPVTLTHEEHSSHTIAKGLYEILRQMEHDVSRGLRLVAD